MYFFLAFKYPQDFGGMSLLNTPSFMSVTFCPFNSHLSFLTSSFPFSGTSYFRVEEEVCRASELRLRRAYNSSQTMQQAVLVIDGAVVVTVLVISNKILLLALCYLFWSYFLTVSCFVLTIWIAVVTTVVYQNANRNLWPKMKKIVAH